MLFAVAASACSTETQDESTSEPEISVTAEEPSVRENESTEPFSESAPVMQTTRAETTTKQETTTKAEDERKTTTSPAPASTTAAATAAQTVSSGSFSASDVACTIGGVSIRPNVKWSSYKDSFGTPSSTQQAPSCHFDGMDNIYYYNGFAIYTYMNGSESYVYDIEITSPSISTGKGIRVGSTADAVIAAYGTGYASKSDSLIEYRSGSQSIYFTLSGGNVSVIEFYCD